MLATFKQHHPIAWRIGFIVLPFATGVAAYFALAAAAPTFPQSIRNFLDAKLQPLRELPIVTRILGPTIPPNPESPIDTLMKHYATLKSEQIHTQIVSDPLPPNNQIIPQQDPPNPDRATWNTTNTGDMTPPAPLDMGNEADGPLYQLAMSTEANARIRALEALSDASNRQAVRACVEALIDSDPVVRRHASRAMERVDRDILYREWIHVLQHGPQDLLAAFDAKIPLLQEQIESNALAGLASGASNRIERLAAIYTLGRIRSDAALPLLAGYAWSSDLELGQTATAAIAEMRSPQAVGALVDLTVHYDADIRWYAINGLGILKGKDALAALESVIASGLEPLAEIRILAVNHLGEAKDAGSIAPLVDAMNRYPGLRYDAMYALSQITSIQDFKVQFEWNEWYDAWSRTPQARAAARRHRQIPATQVAVMPLETATPLPQQPRTTPEPKQLPNDTIEPTSPVTVAPQRPTPNKPLQVKRTGGRGSFGTSDLSPAELMLRGGFSSAKP